MTNKANKRSFLEKNLHLIVGAVVVFLVGAIYIYKSNAKSQESTESVAAEAAVAQVPAAEAPDEGRIAPDFALTSTDGKTIKLSEYRGKVVVLDFWATWCPPCKAEIPDFIKLYSKYRNDGFQMLGISLDQGGLNDVVSFMKDYGINYPIALGTEEVVSAYGGIRGIPTTFVIDKKGYVRGAFEGYRDASVFQNLIQKLTEEK